MSEKILGVIGNTEGKGKGRTMKRWFLIFASDKVIALKMSGTLGLALSSLSGILAELERADVKRRIKKMEREVKQSSLEELIKADKDNFTIPYSDIERVEMSKGGLLSPTRIRFLTAGKTYSFNLLERKRFGEYVDLIRTIFPEKIHVS